jgi:ribosomal protein L37AE/L43A
VVDNKFIQCNACGTKINLRIQVGAYDIPFHIQCPTCQSTMHGKVYIEEYNINVENADVTNCDDKEFYSVELSAEFPTRKSNIQKARRG